MGLIQTNSGVSRTTILFGAGLGFAWHVYSWFTLDLGYRAVLGPGFKMANEVLLSFRFTKPYIPLSDYVSKIMIEIGFNMRGEIIWNKSAGAGISTAWGSFQSASNPILRDVHEYILIFSKGNYKRERDKEEKELRKDNITKEEFIEWTKSVWTMNTESAKRMAIPPYYIVLIPRTLL